MICSKRNIFTLLIATVLYGTGVITHWSPVEARETSGKALKKRLLARKKSFDRYLNERDLKRKDLRKSALQHTVTRARQTAKAKRARDDFQRSANQFPVQAYRKFAQNRDLKMARRDRARLNFQSYREKLRKIEQQKKYRVDKAKAYRLDEGSQP